MADEETLETYGDGPTYPVKCSGLKKGDHAMIRGNFVAKGHPALTFLTLTPNELSFVQQQSKNLVRQQALFLDASTHLYKRLCPSVDRLVGPSVRWLVRNHFFKGQIWIKGTK